jgi:hypothetical protein
VSRVRRFEPVPGDPIFSWLSSYPGAISAFRSISFFIAEGVLKSIQYPPSVQERKEKIQKGKKITVSITPFALAVPF